MYVFCGSLDSLSLTSHSSLSSPKLANISKNAQLSHLAPISGFSPGLYHLWHLVVEPAHGFVMVFSLVFCHTHIVTLFLWDGMPRTRILCEQELYQQPCTICSF